MLCARFAVAGPTGALRSYTSCTTATIADPRLGVADGVRGSAPAIAGLASPDRLLNRSPSPARGGRKKRRCGSRHRPLSRRTAPRSTPWSTLMACHSSSCGPPAKPPTRRCCRLTRGPHGSRRPRRALSSVGHSQPFPSISVSDAGNLTLPRESLAKSRKCIHHYVRMCDRV
jgi:hypothetical protein